jgi:hypothetical protein
MEKKEKTYKIYEIVALELWYREFLKEKNKEMPISDQWNLSQNMKEISQSASNFHEFQEKLKKEIQEEFFTEEKTEKITKDGEELMKIKDEFLPQYQEKVGEVNKELEEISKEEKKFTLRAIDVDNLVASLGNETKITIDDLNMLSAFN